MPRYEYSQGTSDKFWEVQREGTTVTVRYGRIGTDGTTKSKDHPSEEAAQKDADKQAAAKVKKGYVLVEEGVARAKQPLVGLEKEIGIWEHPTHFAFRRIVDFDPEKGLTQASKGVAYRVAFLEDDGGQDEMVEALEALGKDTKAGELKGLTIGPFEECFEGFGELIEPIRALQSKCPGLEALYLGDVISEECEISWINHGDWAPLVSGFPKLEHFRVRGNADASAFSSATLRSLVVQSMCSKKTTQSIAAADLPELEHLELWLGTDEYGGDASVEDLVPILSGAQFPKLRYLGLRNAQIADDVCEAIATAPILDRIEVLDLSLGVLTDRGGNALLASPAVKKLKCLDLHFNYLSEDVAKKLRGHGANVDTSRGDADMGEDEEYRFVSVGE